MQPTPTDNDPTFRPGDFACLAEALDYAAGGQTGFNFFDSRGRLAAALSYAALREEAHALARRLAGLGLERGARAALLADTDPGFVRAFFACQYAGLVPVPLPAASHLGSRRAYTAQLRRLVEDCGAEVVVAPPAFLSYLAEAVDGMPLRFLGDPIALAALPEALAGACPLGPGELAYIQYTSGTARLARGVMVTQRALMTNLGGIISRGVGARPGDRCVSWLPFYHDMGFVGFVLAPLASQLSVDYLSPTDFAKRPHLWLALMTRARATVSFSPSFGYDLCARRLRAEDVGRLDLSAWRVAGVGAEMIRPDALERFAEALEPAGFDRKAFVACYGMAECALAVSFAPIGQGIEVECVERDALLRDEVARPVDDLAEEAPAQVSRFVGCGIPLPEYEVEIRDEAGRPLPDRRCGVLYLRGPSVMAGYHGNAEATRAVLSPDGWLDTGDVGYRVNGALVITGRRKDLLIINGRNIWPQELEGIAEQQPEVRTGSAAAFSVPGAAGEETAVMVIQSRPLDPARRGALIETVQRTIREELGINCLVELVPLHTLPRTSSGKLSRAGAREDFLRRRDARGRSGPVAARA
jgi:fatty-acyl-CoA synthase